MFISLHTYLHVSFTGRLHMGLVSPEDANNAFKKMKRLVSAGGQEISISTPQELLHMKTSVVLQDSSYTILLSIPVGNSDDLYFIKSFISFPLQLGKSQVMISPNENLLAISKTNKFVETTPEKLALFCDKMNRDTHLCPEINIVFNADTPTCLSSLYKADDEGIMAHCKMFITPNEDDYVQSYGGGQFVSYTNQPGFFSVECRDSQSPPDQLQLRTISTISLGANCKATLPKYTIYGTKDFHYFGPPKHFFFNEKIIGLLENVTKEENSAFHKSRAQLQKVTFKEMEELLRPPPLGFLNDYLPHLSLGSSAASVIVIMILGLVCVYCCYQKCSQRVSKTPAAPNLN